MRSILLTILWSIGCVSAYGQVLLDSIKVVDITNEIHGSLLNSKLRDSLLNEWDLYSDNQNGLLAHIEITNHSDLTNWTLELDREELSHFRLIQLENSGEISIKRSGLFEPTTSQDGMFPLQNKYFYLNLELKQDVITELFLSYRK